MSDSWIVQNLNNAFAAWNGKLTEIWQLVSETPQAFKGGDIWNLVVNINGALQAIGYGLLILFFAMAVFKSAASFQDFKRPEYSLRLFIRFVAAKTAITYGLEIMTTIFTICGGIVTQIASGIGNMTAAVTLPAEMVTTIESVGFLASIPLWLVTLLGSLIITVLSFIMILTVYSRFFRLYMYTALAPIPLSSFGGEVTAGTGKAFIKSYIGVCMEGAVIVLACVIYSAFVGSGAPGIVDPNADAVAQVWGYLCEVIFDMLVLVGLVKGADHIVKEMMAL